MTNPDFELSAPDAATVERFNTFVERHAGYYSLGGYGILLETCNFSDPDDPQETSYIVELTETVRSENEVHKLHTDFHSHEGTIGKSSWAVTSDEQKAYEAKCQADELKMAVEAALIGDDDPDTVTRSLLRGSIKTQTDIANLYAALTKSDDKEHPASALEVTELLTMLQLAVDTEPME